MLHGCVGMIILFNHRIIAHPSFRPAVSVHEYLITIQDDVDMILSRRWTMTTVVCFLNRVVMVVVPVITVWPYNESVSGFHWHLDHDGSDLISHG